MRLTMLLPLDDIIPRCGQGKRRNGCRQRKANPGCPMRLIRGSVSAEALVSRAAANF
jgi:hypothetical protein